MKRVMFALLAATVLAAPLARAQQFTTDDPVIRGMWAEGMERSQVYRLAQALLDSVGPRLTGTPGMEAASQWIRNMYGSWGVDAKTEQYGTWMRWSRGRTHIDLVEPRVRTLEGMTLAWSPGTGRETVRGELVVLPEVSTAAEFEVWLPTVRGKFVATSFPQPTCRPRELSTTTTRAKAFRQIRTPAE